DITRLMTFTQLIVSVDAIFVTHKFEVSIKKFENAWRSRDCLNTADIRNRRSIRAVDDVKTLDPLSFERPDIIVFERVSGGRVTFHERSEESPSNADREVVVIWKGQDRNVTRVRTGGLEAGQQVRFKRPFSRIKISDRRSYTDVAMDNVENV